MKYTIEISWSFVRKIGLEFKKLDSRLKFWVYNWKVGLWVEIFDAESKNWIVGQKFGLSKVEKLDEVFWIKLICLNVNVVM